LAGKRLETLPTGVVGFGAVDQESRCLRAPRVARGLYAAMRPPSRHARNLIDFFLLPLL